MAETLMTIPLSPYKTHGIEAAKMMKKGTWKADDLKLLEGYPTMEPMGSPAFSSCSTTVPFSPAASIGSVELPSPMSDRLAAESPPPMIGLPEFKEMQERKMSYPEEGFFPSNSRPFFDDDDSDDDIFIGRPLWSYSGPSLEELLALERSERGLQIINNHDDDDRETGEEDEVDEAEETN